MQVSDTATREKKKTSTIIALQSEALKVQQQFDVAYTHWSNGAEAMVMILFWSIGMGSVMKKIRRSLFGRYFCA